MMKNLTMFAVLIIFWPCSSWATLSWEDHEVAPYVGGSDINVQIEREPSTGTLGILDCSVGPGTYPIRYSQGYGDTWTTTTVTANSDGSDRWGLAFHPVTRIPYTSYQNGGSLILSHFNGSVWAAETVVSSEAGGGSSLAFEPITGEPYIAYIGSGGVNLAWHDASGWYTEPIDSGFGSFSSPSLSFDPADDSVCVGYAHTFNGIYFARRLGVANWDVSLVESISFPRFPILRFSPITGQPALAYEISMGAPVNYAAFNGSGWDTWQVSTDGHTCWDPLGLSYLPDGTPMVVYTAGSFSSIPVSKTSFHVAWMADGTFSTLSEHDYGAFNWNGPVDMLTEGNTVHVAYQAANIGVHLASAAIAEPPCWQEVLFDDFDDGNYDGWSVTHPKTGEPATPPDIVPSPQGYSLRGVGSGYSQDPGLNVFLTYPLVINNAGQLKVEMRAKSGPQWPNSAWVVLISGDDSYSFGDYGEGNQWAQFTPNVDGQSEWYNYSINANVWHDFAWIRDADGWWSLYIDGNLVWEDFCQDNRLTSFYPIGMHILRDQSEIEWVRISVPCEPEPPCVVEIEDSDSHEWIYCEPVSCAIEGTLTDPANAFDGDWNTYAEVRSNGNNICSICCGLQETWSVPIGADLEFHYRIESVDVYQQAIYIRFWNPDTSQWDDQWLYGHNSAPWDILDGVADEILPIPALYVDEDGCFKSNIILLNKWNTNAWSRLYETSITAEVPCTVAVPVDIKPQSCPNPLNLKSKGVLPVAVLGTEEFDASNIDPASIRLKYGDDGEGVAPLRSSLEDVATAMADGDECECTEDGPDGYTDLTLKFRTKEVVEELLDEYDDLEKGQMLSLELRAELSGGSVIEGSDCVKLVGNVPKWLEAKRWDGNEDGIVNLLDLAGLAEYWLQSTVE